MPETRDVLRGVIFDHSTLLVNPRDERLLQELRNLMQKLRAFGLKVGVFSTHPKDIDAELRARELPEVDLFVTRPDLEARWPGRKVSKGSTVWLEWAAEAFETETFRLLYIGDDRQDWLTAINTATFYLHAGWGGRGVPGTISYTAETPADVTGWLTHFLLLPPRWQYALDDPARGLFVRSLLGALVELPGSREGRTFRLQAVFGDEGRNVQIGDSSAKDLLMLHALAGLYLEGFIRPNSLFAVYPSHTPGQINDNLRSFLHPVSKLFGGYFKEDLLVRAMPAIDTSRERGMARAEGREPNVSFADQTNTVHVNPDYAKTIRTRDRTILVFDDFTTTGRSLDWARSLLRAAGAGRVVLMTVGKYPGPYHRCHTPRTMETITPFSRKDYNLASDFRTVNVRMREDAHTRRVIETSFKRIRENRDYPVAEG